MESLENYSGFEKNVNMSTNVTDHWTDIQKYYTWPILYLAGTVNAFLTIIGIFANLLTIVALLVSWMNVRNATTVFIINMSVSDLIYCSFYLSLTVSAYLQGGWSHGMTVCQIQALVGHANVAVSLLFMVMITINRYVCVAHCAIYHLVYRWKYVAAMAVFCWGLILVLVFPTLLGVWGKFGYSNMTGTCTILKDENGRSSEVTLQAIGFFLPLTVIVACYVRIFIILRKSENRLQGYRLNKTSSRSEHEDRLIKMVLVICVAFVISFLPILIYRALDSERLYTGVYLVCLIPLHSSACINPFIYVIMNKPYRTAYLALFRCTKRSADHEYDCANRTEQHELHETSNL